MQVHEEVLRLLMVGTERLGVPKLAEYLQATLANSKKSRRCGLLPKTCIFPKDKFLWCRKTS